MTQHESDQRGLQERLEVQDRPARRGRRGGREREQLMVPPASFTSYYGRPVLKPSPWEADIPAYLFAGGLAAGSALLAAGGDLTGRPALRRTGRLGAAAGLAVSMVALVHDLGRPSRFANMLRTAKLTSPMSVGTWIISGFAPFAGVAAAAEVAGLLPAVQGSRVAPVVRVAGRVGGVGAGFMAPALAAYTAVLLADTATPTWHDGFRELPFVFVGSAAAASGGLGLIGAPVAQNGPARRFAVGGAVLDLVAAQRMEASMGLSAEPLQEGLAGRLMRASQLLTISGATGALLGGRWRPIAALSGAALIAGSVCTRFGIFEAGQASAKDPKYTVVPQRARLEAGEPVRFEPSPPRSQLRALVHHLTGR